MTDFVVTITNPAHLAGITAAREVYNASNPEAPIEADADYVQFVMSMAAQSYASHYGE